MTDADQSRQRVLDVARLSTPPASGYWGDVQDVCKIALDAMDERDEMRRRSGSDGALRELRAWASDPTCSVYGTGSIYAKGGVYIQQEILLAKIDELLAAKPAPTATTAAPAVGDDELDECRRWLQEYFDSGEKLTPSARAVAELCRRALAGKP